MGPSIHNNLAIGFLAGPGSLLLICCLLTPGCDRPSRRSPPTRLPAAEKKVEIPIELKPVTMQELDKTRLPGQG